MMPNQFEFKEDYWHRPDPGNLGIIEECPKSPHLLSTPVICLEYCGTGYNWASLVTGERIHDGGGYEHGPIRVRILNHGEKVLLTQVIKPKKN